MSLKWSKQLSNNSFVNSVAISPNGNHVVTGTYYFPYPGTTRRNTHGRYATYCFDQQGNQLWKDEYEGNEGVYALAISGDSRVAAAGGLYSGGSGAPPQIPDRALLRAFNVANGSLLLDYTTISTRVSSVALSQDGSVLAAVDLVGGLYVFVGSAAGFPVQPSRPFFPTARRLYSVAVHGNGQWLAACGDRGRVHLLTISQQGNISQPFTWIAPDRVPFLSVAIANTGDFFVVGGGNVVYLFTRSSMIAGTGPVARFNTPTGGTPQDVRWVAISGDGSLVSAVQNMGRDETGLLLTLSNTGGALNSKWQQPLDHNPNSTSIDTAGQYVTAADGHPVGTPGKFYLFNASNGTKLWDYSTNNMNWPMAICGNGTAAAAGSDNGTLYYFLP